LVSGYRIPDSGLGIRASFLLEVVLKQMLHHLLRQMLRYLLHLLVELRLYQKVKHLLLPGLRQVVRRAALRRIAARHFAQH